MQIVLPNVAHVLLANPGCSLDDVDALFTDEQVRLRLLKKVTYPPVLKWWLNTYNRTTQALHE